MEESGSTGVEPGVDSGAAPAGDRWEQLLRWGPLPLLGAAVLMSAAAADLLMSPAEMYAAAVLTLAAVALQLWWTARPAPRLDVHPASGQIYFAVRTVLAFSLTWLNPFFAVYALIGYFDSGRLLPGRRVWAGLIVTAVTMAGSQSGGLPPEGGLGWSVFGGLFLLNSCLVLVFSRIDAQQAESTRAKVATIAELERTNARLEQALQENAGLHAQLLVQAREAGVADERSRLAAEIHDTLAQGLAGIITQLQAATDSAESATARGHVERAAALARQSLGEARRSVQDLGPGALEHAALPEALKKTVDGWAAATEIRGEFTVTGPAEPLHEEIEATLLRISQEALANVGRHAHATRVGVTLSYMDDEVSLDVRDDGRGFDTSDSPAAPDRTAGDPERQGTGRGFGLGGMRARAERVAGSVDIESEPGQGTAVSARVPLVRHA
ncbi:MAG TPA: sensor histidine kinase [Streptomyces sp.]|nr:sensor histidine kinase [Streptomyces sp.]